MNDHAAATHPEAHGTHVMPVRVLVGVTGTLMLLTALTVATSRIDLGDWNVALALGIACTKAALVALFFMHLKYENKFLMVVLGAAALFAVLFVSFVVFDTVQYQPEIRAVEKAGAAAAAAKGK